MLDDALIAEYKIRAAKAGKSLSSMVAEAMRTYHPDGPAKPRPEKWEIKVLGKGEWIAPMKPHETAALMDFLDDADDHSRR